MQISLNWLKELVPLQVSTEELAERMTMLGMEIEAIREPGKEIKDIYVGQIVDIQPHPDADKLVVCQTNIGGEEPLQIICGATNMKVGDKVPTAIDGSCLPGGFKIGNRKMRGVQSCGMMCSLRELGLGEEHAGLMILDPDAPIGADIKEVLGLNDVVFEIEVTPNRGDWAGMIGVARELSAYYNLPLQLPEIHLDEEGTAAKEVSGVTIEDPDLCPRYAGRVLRNVVIQASPPWLCARLIAAGQRPINNIVDITNYVLLETGHPLHAFDFDKLAENRIVVRRSRPGEGIKTLDEQEHALTEDMLVIADAKNPQAVGGVMGGFDSEVDANTKHVFLESAYFTPRSIRSTARKLALLTEAAQNIQRGADCNMVPYALNRAAALMQELAGASVAPGVLDAYPEKHVAPQVRLRFDRTDRLLGVAIAKEEQQAILKKLGFTASQVREKDCLLEVPSWRHDVTHEADLIEEIARHYGYDRIPVTMPPVRQSEIIFAPQEKTLRALRHRLAALGLTEVLNWSFSSRENVSRARLETPSSSMVMLENPLSENYAGMRSSLIPTLYATAAYNCKRGANSVAIFEVGPVYLPVEDELLP
ncbi:MAG: phenylalanine--tRNA ligase subunit beta [Candidatus Hydrogenedentes bacterium]|nr:phenylalanine--tRNA ligase subunit beta [Candidatus Hydrogenedentota bacterium]